MANTVIEELSGQRLVFLGVVLLLALLACFLAGGTVAPTPSSSQNVLGTLCVDRHHEPDRWFQVWSVIGSQESCDRVESLDDLTDSRIAPDQVVVAFQVPLHRGGRNLAFSRWQQSLIGIIDGPLYHGEQREVLPNATLEMTGRLGYKNRGDETDEWTWLASSDDGRHLTCKLYSEHTYNGFSCDPSPLFELVSLDYDYYLLNLRLPCNAKNRRNIGIGMQDMNLVVIFQNGGFTKVFLSLKTVFFPLVVSLLIWFWRRVRALQLDPAPVERMLLALGISLSALNLPLEYLTLWFDMPYLPLVADLRRDVFYGVLLSSWLVLVGEHFAIRRDHRLSAYRKHQCVAYVSSLGCVSLITFDMLDHVIQVNNPFRSIWTTNSVVADVARGFAIFISVLAGLYLCFLSWLTCCMFRVAKWRPVAASKNHESGVHGFGFLLMVSVVTLTCAALTVVLFILGRVAEGQLSWRVDIRFSDISSIQTGVYGMWNLYTLVALFLLAPVRHIAPSTAAGSAAKTEAR